MPEAHHVHHDVSGPAPYQEARCCCISLGMRHAAEHAKNISMASIEIGKIAVCDEPFITSAYTDSVLPLLFPSRGISEGMYRPMRFFCQACTFY